jgi:hypothetical protein
MSDVRTVQLPSDLCASAEKKFSRTFGSVEELLTFILSDLLRDDADRLDRAEQQLVEERLRELGYL